MKLLSNQKGIVILLLLIAAGLFANALGYWISPATEAQECTVGEQVVVVPLSAGGDPAFNKGIHGGYWTIYAVIKPDGKVYARYYEIVPGESEATVYHGETPPEIWSTGVTHP